MRNRLDEEVASRLLGYRWVTWKSHDSFPLPGEEEGRFLAPPDGPRASEQVPAGPEVPLAKEPDRYVPEFSTDLKDAFDVAVAAGLFVSANAFLTVSVLGEWRVHEEDGTVLGASDSLPEALCRAALAWHELHGPDGPVGDDDKAE